MICSLSSQKNLLSSPLRIRTGVKTLTFFAIIIERKISTFEEITNQMEERKAITYSLRKRADSFKNSLNTIFSPVFGLLGVTYSAPLRMSSYCVGVMSRGAG